MKDTASIPMRVLRFCADECTRQHSGEMSVFNMAEAWLFANDLVLEPSITMNDILNLGKAVEPEKNLRGLRKVSVWLPSLQPPPWREVERLMTDLLQHQRDTTALEFYVEFEKIHPFVDGNGRVGALLYNVLSGTIRQPVAPPDVFAHV